MGIDVDVVSRPDPDAEDVPATVGELRTRLRKIIDVPIDTPEEAEISAEAARLLSILMRLEEQTALLESRLGGGLGEHSLKGLTLDGAARRVLDECGFALHAREIADMVYARGWRHPRPPYLRRDRIHQQLAARLTQRPDVFARVGNNMFVLKEWGGYAKIRAVDPATDLVADPLS